LQGFGIARGPEDSLAENLAADRFAVHRAGSVEEALTLLDDVSPDAAVVDIRLPGRSGLELVGAVRGCEGPWDPGIPVVLISGRVDAHTAVRGIERGADDFVAKPLHQPDLHARLGGHLRRRRGRQRARRCGWGRL
jgi:DNA-binding response OmpR family regulator